MLNFQWLKNTTSKPATHRSAGKQIRVHASELLEIRTMLSANGVLHALGDLVSHECTDAGCEISVDVPQILEVLETSIDQFPMDIDNLFPADELPIDPDGLPSLPIDPDGIPLPFDPDGLPSHPFDFDAHSFDFDFNFGDFNPGDFNFNDFDDLVFDDLVAIGNLPFEFDRPFNFDLPRFELPGGHEHPHHRPPHDSGESDGNHGWSND